jgi:hypothetical protein
MSRSDDRDSTEDLRNAMNDPPEWADEPEETEVRPSKSEIVSFRLPTDEFARVLNAASEAGESLSTFIRGAIALRLYGTPVGPVFEITTSGGSLTVRSHLIAPGSRNAAPGSWVPDFPPLVSQHVA